MTYTPSEILKRFNKIKRDRVDAFNEYSKRLSGLYEQEQYLRKMIMELEEVEIYSN